MADQQCWKKHKKNTYKQRFSIWLVLRRYHLTPNSLTEPNGEAHVIMTIMTQLRSFVLVLLDNRQAVYGCRKVELMFGRKVARGGRGAVLYIRCVNFTFFPTRLGDTNTFTVFTHLDDIVAGKIRESRVQHFRHLLVWPFKHIYEERQQLAMYITKKCAIFSWLEFIHKLSCSNQTHLCFFFLFELSDIKTGKNYSRGVSDVACFRGNTEYVSLSTKLCDRCMRYNFCCLVLASPLPFLPPTLNAPAPPS